MPTWTFVRHGQSQANAERWFAGWVDSELTELGRRQATQARATLANLPVTRAFASDLQRAKNTAELMLQGRPIRLSIDEALRERSCGQWERRQIEDIERAGKMHLFRDWSLAPPGGESLREVAVRATRFLSEHEGDGGYTLVVAHGGLIRAVVGALDGMAEEAIGRWRPENCEFIVRDVEPGGWAKLLGKLQAEP